MTLALADVKSGSVTTSVRDTTIGGLEIHVGDAIGLLDGDIVVAEPAGDIKAAAQKLLEKMLDEDDEIVTLIYGADSTKSDAEELASYIEELDSEMEVEIHSGNQPLYPIYLEVE